MTSIYQFRADLAGWTGGPGINTFYARGPGPISQSDMNDFAEQLRAMYNTFTLYLLGGSTVNIQSAVMELEDTTGALVAEHTITPPAQVGGIAGNSPTSRATMLKFKFTTDLVHGGQTVRGGNYLGPIAASAMTTDGAILPALMTAVPGAFDGLLDVLGPLRLAVWSRPRKADPANGISARAGAAGHVQSVTAARLPGVLRSRRD